MENLQRRSGTKREAVNHQINPSLGTKLLLDGRKNSRFCKLCITHHKAARLITNGHGCKDVLPLVFQWNVCVGHMRIINYHQFLSNFLPAFQRRNTTVATKPKNVLDREK